MRKYYQTEWQGIQFSDFTDVSSQALAGAEFYQAFYQEFFKRYRSWDDLSPQWMAQKLKYAEFIANRENPSVSILSVGCGLGAVEHFVNKLRPDIDLYVHEVAPAAWSWIAPEFSKDRKLVGLIPGCMLEAKQFDLIYLSAVDYAMDQKELASLLAILRGFLVQGGKCMIFSASFENEPESLAERIVAGLKMTKRMVQGAFDAIGVRNRGQFWGWFRNNTEYHEVMTMGGYSDLSVGCVDPYNPATYWIAGSVASSSSESPIS